MHPARAGWLLAGLAATVACTVSTETERELGVDYAASVDSQVPMLDDSIVVQYVTRLGRSLASHTSRADLDWRFKVANVSAVNAFALPGGFVYLTRGLIEQSDSLDQLAGVMGHEIGHVVRRHNIKQLEEAERRDVGIVALCTLTRFCRSLGGAIAVRIGADADAAQYSQAQETEADSEAVVNTVRAGIDPNGLPQFFAKLLAQRTEDPTPIDAFFATHPTDEARIAAVRRQIAKAGVRPGTLVRDRPDFHAMLDHLRSLPPPPQYDTVDVATRMH